MLKPLLLGLAAAAAAAEEAPPAPEACGFATEPVAKDIGGGVII
jgi:hypothetical protein